MSSTIEYVCQKYVLTYRKHDKSISIVHVDDVIGWTQEEFEKLKICRRVKLMVLVLQCATSYEGLKDTLKFVFEMKRKKQTIGFIQTHFNPVRGLNRQRLPPVYPLYTASEGSNFNTDPSDSIALHNQDTAAEAVALKPLSPLKTQKFPVSYKALHNQDMATEAVALKPLPPLITQKSPVTYKTLHNQDMATEAVALKPLPSLKSQKRPGLHKVQSVQLPLST
nr:uncharacterized protein LOC124807238 isoform X1 [Hydra vulgaris]XP_047124901.1 uncharacterized protein LOC124807238 isoform X1 [Hydra vulgaris]